MSPEQEEAPALPTYPPPQTGLQMADPRQVKPLYKMLKQMIKPKPRTRTRTSKPKKWAKEYPFYLL